MYYFLPTELQESLQNSPSDRMAIVSKKIASLGKMYVHSERYFPLGKYHLLRYMRDSECCHAIVKHQSKLSGIRTLIRLKLVILPTFKPFKF